MKCAACDQEMPDQGAICVRCNVPDPVDSRGDREPISHHALALTVHRLKRLVMASFGLGIVAAPVAIYIATRAIKRYGGSTTTDPATLRQLIHLRRLATTLLVLWAFVLGGYAAFAFSGLSA
jgi:hypothetical protein